MAEYVVYVMGSRGFVLVRRCAGDELFRVVKEALDKYGSVIVEKVG